MKTITILTMLAFSTLSLANEYCGKLYKISYGYEDISSLRFYSNAVTDDPNTPYNEVFATLSNTQDAFELIYKLTFEENPYLYYADDNALNDLDLNVCFREYQEKIRTYKGTKYLYIEDAQYIVVSSSKMNKSYSGPVADSVKYLRLISEKKILEQKKIEIEKRLQVIDEELQIFGFNFPTP